MVEAHKNKNQVRSFINYMLEIAASEERIWLRYNERTLLEGISLFLMKEIDWEKYDGSPAHLCYNNLKSTRDWLNYRNPLFYKYAKPNYHFCSTL